MAKSIPRLDLLLRSISMGDDRYSASELRQRYGPGGSLKDSDLSASQIRARHGVHNNTFSQSSSFGLVSILVLVIAAGVGGLAFYKFSQ